MLRSLVVGAVLLGAGGMTGVAHADDALGNMIGPRELAVGEAMRGGSTGASGIGMNPAGIGLNRELVFEGGYGYRGSDSASLFGVSACDSTAGVPGCFFYDYAGENPELGGTTLTRKTHVGGFASSRMLTPRILLGASLKYFHFDSEMPDEKAASGVNWDFGATIRVTDMINLGVTGYNLYGAESSQFPRAVGAGVMARPLSSVTLTFDSRWRLQGDQEAARYGGGLEWFLTGHDAQQGYPVRFGVLHDNNTMTKGTYLSGGIGLAGLKWGIDVGARRQVQNGNELLVMASMRFFGPREPAPTLDSYPGE